MPARGGGGCCLGKVALLKEGAVLRRGLWGLWAALLLAWPAPAWADESDSWCFLGRYRLAPCDTTSWRVAEYYSPYARSIPTQHLATIRCLYWTHEGVGEAQPLTGCIGLPPTAGLFILAHETGHQVSLHYPGGLLAQFRVRFWPGGVQASGWPSAYARVSAEEDFAESYAYLVMRDDRNMPERREWLLSRLPELAR